jgi:hypothetical protein
VLRCSEQRRWTVRSVKAVTSYSLVRNRKHWGFCRLVSLNSGLINTVRTWRRWTPSQYLVTSS